MFGSPHTLANCETAYWESELNDDQSFESWSEEGGVDSMVRANRRWKKTLEDYEPPPMDESTDAALKDFMDKKKSSMEDAWY
jgi:trimethylamine--corrinoid protein Co-methyltransferase